MACETFLKIVSKCKRKFVIMQVGQSGQPARTGLQERDALGDQGACHVGHPALGLSLAPPLLARPPGPPDPELAAAGSASTIAVGIPVRAPQVGESEPFISELLTGLSATIQDLETHQIHMFYEAVGLMISADTGAAPA